MLITIVTPTFNAVKFLQPCLDSVKANAGPGLEIDHVVCDGGSTDGTVELARSSGARVVVERDEGIFDAVNKGSFNSQGELLGYLGGDDMMLPGALRKVVDAYRRSGRRWVVGGIDWIDEHDRYMGGLAAPPTWMTPRMLTCLGWNPTMHMSCYFSRGLFEELGGFDLRYRIAGDYDMMSRARLIGPYARINQPIACFRRTGQNTSFLNIDLRETDSLISRFGPKSDLERRFWRVAMKLWFNGRNPRWALEKVLAPIRIGLGQQERAYF